MTVRFSPPVSGAAADSPLVRWGLMKKPPADEGRLSPAGRDAAEGGREGGGGGKVVDFDGGRDSQPNIPPKQKKRHPT